MAPPTLHPAFTVGNVKNWIPLILEPETGKYVSWAELFRIHCRVFEVIDHIITPAPEDEPAEETSDKKLWAKLDSLVLQWIYGTISPDLLQTILEPGSTAMKTWERLEGIFRDNKHSRAVQLENQFSQVILDDFPGVSAYCKELKNLADQLANVDAPVSNNRMVLQAIAGLNEIYDSVAAIIQQSDPLPTFYEVRSKLVMEESRKAKQANMASNAANSALFASSSNRVDDGKESAGNGGVPQRGLKPGGNQNSGRGRRFSGQGSGQGHLNQNNGGRQQDGGGGGRSQSDRGRGRGNNNQGNRQWQQNNPPWWNYQQNWGHPPQWAFPPCPYPTTGWARPPNQGQNGVLGHRLSQTYNAHGPGYSASSSYVPIDIESAMHTMSLNVPDTFTWIPEPLHT